MTAAFSPLRVHSHGSLLYGVASPEQLVARALELGCASLALTDRDNLYLAVRFYQAARAEGLKPLLGCVLTTPDHEALLIAIDRRGFAHLCELITRRMLEPRFDLVAALAPGRRAIPAAGLHVVVESPGLAASLLAAGVPAARGVREEANGARGGDGGVWLGVRGLARERPLLAGRHAAARELGLSLVATGDVTLLAPDDLDAHRAAVTAAAGELLDRMPATAFAAPDATFVAPAAWDARVRAVCAAAALPHAASEALANNRALAARCRLELDLGVPIFPRAPRPDGDGAARHLRRQCEAGIARCYAGAARRAANARLERELSIIERMEFTDYFLLVADIVRFARERGIPTVGRGSGASSLVSYVLGLTNVDPIRYGLAFERFLHPARRDCPDLDIDLCWWRRDEVIAHVYDTYGHDRVAMISTHATLGARSAFRETAKALGVPNSRVNALARAVPRQLEPPYRRQLEALPGARHVDWREPVLERALALAERLDGAPRHLSVHSGGLVIADRPLTYYVPLERAAKDVVVTQFEMRAIEAIGLVKMDLLGNRALSTIAECIELANDRRRRVPTRSGTSWHDDLLTSDAASGHPPAAPGRPDAALTLHTIPDPDAATIARLARGDTLNCFQLESPAMRHLLRMLRPRHLDDVIAAVALIRPGAAGTPSPEGRGMKEVYCRRARGQEPATYLHPRLAPVLAGTHGVLLYEEDVMRVAAALTGLSFAEGDDLRRAIGHARTDAEFVALEHGFVLQAARAGVDAVTARAVWRELTRFAAYAFCKAHAAGYGTLGYHSAYLKTHFPTEYATAILNHHAGMYATWVHVEDLRREGVRFLPPCVAHSESKATLEPTGARAAVRVGLSRVFGLHAATAERIVGARRDGAFASLADFVERARPSLPELESLILAGALDAFGRTRPSLLLEARAGGRAWSRAGVRPALAPPPVAPVRSPELPEYAAAERVRHECAATGLWFSGHPLDALPPGVEAAAVPAARLERHGGRVTSIVGLPCAWRRVETRGGSPMLFLTVADRSGVAECALFPDAYARHAAALRGAALRVTGRVSDALDAITLEAARVEILSPAAGPSPPADVRGRNAQPFEHMENRR
jgi:DNA-directed DNA polymerase III PolC